MNCRRKTSGPARCAMDVALLCRTWCVHDSSTHTSAWFLVCDEGNCDLAVSGEARMSAPEDARRDQAATAARPDETKRRTVSHRMKCPSSKSCQEIVVKTKHVDNNFILE